MSQRSGKDEEVGLLDEKKALHANNDGETAQQATDLKAWVDANNEPPQEDITNDKIVLGVGYMLAMGVCGTILVALGSTLEDLAEACGTTSTDVGTVFIARGAGAIVGAIVSAKLYLWFEGNSVMTCTLLWLVMQMVVLPYNTSVSMLHVLFFCLGLGTAITDTGCQIMTRKIHGKAAGPWLGANTVAFGISGACVPLMELFTDSLVIQYDIMSVVIFAIAMLMAFGPNPEQFGRLTGGPPRGADGKSMIPHYHVEMVVSFMVFCYIGGKVTSTAYIDTYIDETGVLSTDDEAAVVFVLWTAITVGRLAGVWDQRFLTNKTLPVHLSAFSIGGALAMLLILLFPDNGDCFWVGVAFYGLFNGPCVAYCYDLNNRMTYPSENSMSIVMFGLNFGASLVPYLTTLVWNNGGGPISLIWVILLSMFVPLPLLHVCKYLSYEPSVNPLLKHAYAPVSNSD